MDVPKAAVDALRKKAAKNYPNAEKILILVVTATGEVEASAVIHNIRVPLDKEGH